MTAKDLVTQFVGAALDRARLARAGFHQDYSSRRLDTGDAKYGVDSYKEKDCAAEAAEEGIDGANWIGFEWSKRWEADDIDDNCLHLNEAAIHFAYAYEHLRQYIAAREVD